MKKHGARTVYLTFSSLTAFLFQLSFTVNMVYFVTTARLDPLQLVLVGTVLETSVLIFEVPTGIVADVYSRRLSIIIGVFLISAGFAVTGLWPHFAPILIGQVLWGLGYTFTSGAQQAWISDEIGEEHSAAIFLRGARYSQIGALAATGASVWLAQNQLNTPILVTAGLFVLLGLYLILFMPEDGFHPTPREDRTTWQHMLQTFRSGIGMLRIRPALVGILLIGLFFGMYSEGYDRLWTASLLQRFQLPTLGGLNEVAWMGLIAASIQILSAGSTWLVEKRFDLRHSKMLIRLLAGLSALLLASLAGFALGGNFGLAVGLVVAIGVIRETIYPLYTAWVNRRLDSRVRATVISMSSQVDALGQIAGGPALGVIARQFTIQAGLLGSTILLSPVLVMFAWQIKNGGEAQLEAASEA